MPLEYLSRRPVNLPPDSYIALSVVRNEMLRLPYLLSYYRSIGFDRFFFVDNASTDGTREFLLEQPDAFVFYTDESFGAGLGCGLPWLHAILERFCAGRWVLISDADEILVWPGSERENIHGLRRRIEGVGAEGLFAMLIDMYSDKPLGDIGYIAGKPFLNYAPFFDSCPYFFRTEKAFPHKLAYGGIRSRLLKAYREAMSREQPGNKIRLYYPAASKAPFLRWRRGWRYVASTHLLRQKIALAPMRAALLHFKLFDDIVPKCEIEVTRNEHFQHGQEYRSLGDALNYFKGKSLFDPAVSVRYRNTDQLVSLELMDVTKPF